MFAAAYVAKSGRRYEDDTHSGCLFQAQAAGEPECAGWPHSDDLDVDDLESRMGFVDGGGQFLTRAETLTRYGFDLAEEQPC